MNETRPFPEDTRTRSTAPHRAPVLSTAIRLLAITRQRKARGAAIAALATGTLVIALAPGHLGTPRIEPEHATPRPSNAEVAHPSAGPYRLEESLRYTPPPATRPTQEPTRQPPQPPKKPRLLSPGGEPAPHPTSQPTSAPSPTTTTETPAPTPEATPEHLVDPLGIVNQVLGSVLDGTTRH